MQRAGACSDRPCGQCGQDACHASGQRGQAGCCQGEGLGAWKVLGAGDHGDAHAGHDQTCLSPGEVDDRAVEVGVAGGAPALDDGDGAAGEQQDEAGAGLGLGAGQVGGEAQQEV